MSAPDTTTARIRAAKNRDVTADEEREDLIDGLRALAERQDWELLLSVANLLDAQAIEIEKLRLDVEHERNAQAALGHSFDAMRRERDDMRAKYDELRDQRHREARAGDQARAQIDAIERELRLREDQHLAALRHGTEVMVSAQEKK